MTEGRKDKNGFCQAVLERKKSSRPRRSGSSKPGPWPKNRWGERRGSHRVTTSGGGMSGSPVPEGGKGGELKARVLYKGRKKIVGR